MCINSVTVEKWVEAQKALEHAKRIELELRNKIIEDMKERNPDVIEGTKHHTFGDIDIAVSFKTTKSVDQTALDSVWDSLTDEEKEAFVFKPCLDAKKFKAVQDSAAVASVVTIKPAQASVKFKIVE